MFLKSLIQKSSKNFLQLSKSKNQHYNFASQIPDRIASFKKLDQSDIDHFRSILSEKEIITDESEIDVYNTDWTTIFKGNSSLVLTPTSTQSVSEILKYCNQQKIAVVPQGGNTSLCGGSVPVHDEIILNLKKMKNIVKYDENTNILTTECGAILEELNQQIKQYNAEVPLDLGARGSCQIGGNIATQAGGKYFIKYGPFRANILGLEVVLPDGTILDLQSEVRKDNTGTDLKQLFIGSEGTLGVVTRANILCHKMEEFKNLFVVKCDSFENVMRVFNSATETLGRNLAAIEWIDSHSFDLVEQTMPDLVSNPFSTDNELGKHHYVYVEIGCNHGIEELEDKFFENLPEDSYEDILKAENEQQAVELWKYREEVSPATEKYGHDFKFDFSLNPSLMNKITEDARERINEYGVAVGFGHIGDSNIHLMFSCRKDANPADMEKALEPYLYEYMKDVGGSISAEHGLGRIKTRYLKYQKDQQSIQYMNQIKNMFDPNGILNPYKVLE